MKRSLIIVKKELKRYFDSPLAYITIIVFMIISGWIFASTIFLLNTATIENFTANVPMLMLFLAPAIAMQLLAGEFGSGTIEILGSMPIKDNEIICGKFTAAFVLLTSAIILTLIYPLSISLFGYIDWGQVAGAYIGMLLIGGTFLAAGMLASSISSNQVVAFILGFVIAFALFLAGKFSQVLPAYIRPLIDFIGIDSHWDNISRGVIDIRDLSYFAGMWIFFLFSAYTVFSRRVRTGMRKALSTSLVAGILVLVNLILQPVVFRLDLTRNSIYSLSPASKKVISDLADPVIIKAYFTRDLPAQFRGNRTYLENLLAEYRAFSDGKLKYSMIDPSSSEKNSREAMSSGIMPLKFTESGREKLEIKQGFMGLKILYGDKQEVVPVLDDVSALEYDLTTRIKKITSARMKKIGYIGDFGMPRQVSANITDRYNYTKIDSTGAFAQGSFDSVIVCASADFDADDLALLEKAASQKIPLGIFADRYSVSMGAFSVHDNKPVINSFLQKFGLGLGKGLILDRQNQRIGITTQQGMFSIQNIINYPYFPLVTDLDDNIPVLKDLEAITFPFVSPLTIDESAAENYDIRVLARTSKDSWLDDEPSYVSPMRDYSPMLNQSTGTFTVMALLNDKKSSFRMLVTSNARFINKDYMVTESNAGMFLNAVDWLTEDEELISIRTKSVGDRPLKGVTESRRILVKNIDIFLVPLLVLGTAIYRWRTRELRAQETGKRIIGE